MAAEEWLGEDDSEYLIIYRMVQGKLEKLGNQPKDYDNDMMFATDGSKLEL